MLLQAGMSAPLDMRRTEDVGQRRKSHRANDKTPWEKEGLSHYTWKGVEGEWVGLPGAQRPSKEYQGNPARDLECFRALYAAHAQHGGKHDGVGNYYGVEEATSLLEKAKVTHREAERQGVKIFLFSAIKARPTPQPASQDELLAADPRFVRWGSGLGKFLPVTGAVQAALPDWPPEKELEGAKKLVRDGYEPGWVAEPLPLYLKNSVTLEQRDSEEGGWLTKNMIDSLTMGAIALWNFEDGIPTVISAIDLVKSDAGKLRNTLDGRYVDGSIGTQGLDLPRIRDFLALLRRGDKMAKADCARGFNAHPIPKLESRRRLCFMFRGLIFCCTAAPFGLRDIPHYFQSITGPIGWSVYKEESTTGFVYLDDYGFRVPPGRSADQILQRLTRFGLILGRDKCTAASTVMETLGFKVDTGRWRLQVSERREEKITNWLEGVLRTDENTKVTAKELASFLGRLSSAMDAAPTILLIARPLIQALARALKLDNISAVDLETKKRLRFWWNNAYIAISPASQERTTCQFLKERWDRVHGVDIRGTNRKVMILESDASPSGFGGRLYPQPRGTSPIRDSKEMKIAAGELPEVLQGEDVSTCDREAYGGLMTLRHFAEGGALRGKAIIKVGDHLGLAARHFKGLRGDTRASGYLREQVEFMLENDILPLQSRWASGSLIHVCDLLSRLGEDGNQVGAFAAIEDDSWRRVKAAISQRRWAAPNIDAFADRTNARLPRYATLDLGDTESVAHNAFTLQFGQHDIPWLFPPEHLLQETVSHWRASDSPRAYLMVPQSASHANWFWGMHCRPAEVLEELGGRALSVKAGIRTPEGKTKTRHYLVYAMSR